MTARPDGPQRASAASGDLPAGLGGPAAPLVLVTRPEPEAAALVERLREMGFWALAAPTLRRVRRARALAEDLAPGAAGPPALLLTSPAAARAVGDDLPRAALAPLTAYCVGDETARAAEAAGVGRALSADGDAGDLLARLRMGAAPAGAALVHFRGEDVARPLGPPLRAAGFEVRERVLYAAEPVEALDASARAALSACDRAAALMLSARAARAFALAAGDAAMRPVTALCLSARIADAAAAAGFSCVAAATRPRLDALITLLLELFSPEGPGRESNR